ncbi:MAG TPA: hypothetical protein VFM63_05985 [Pyrinomonadaceae bacterium]|nr:hypothetical protein [Pyrinomonadaceae bacterium]
MNRVLSFSLLFLFLFLLDVRPLQGQEAKVVPGRRVTYPSFEVDVLVHGRPLAEYQDRGRTYVEALRGEEYEIRLRNRTSDYVAVALSVDGLNTIDASRTSAWNGSKWVIEPHHTITISGWQMDSDHAHRFYFTTERDSYAAKLGVRANLGTISAVFYRERRRVIPITPPPHPMPRPGDRDDSQASAEMRSSAGASTGAAKSSRQRDEAATGSGRSVRNDVRYVDMDLESRPAAEVTISYDYGSSISESNPKYRVRGKRDN